MIFNEIYSIYFLTMQRIIEQCIDGDCDDKKAQEIIREYSFNESFVPILSAIKKEEWKVVTKNYQTPIKDKPQIPLTLLQKRFLKTISLDDRFKLFGITFCDMEEVEPIYIEDNICYFDRFNTKDNFKSKEYKRNFQEILKALKENKNLKISFISQKKHQKRIVCTPKKLEYSFKEDCFRLIDTNNLTVNLSGVLSCICTEENSNEHYKKQNYRTVVVEIYDKRNAFERAMLQFSELPKQTIKISERTYQTSMTYFSEQETEILIRILSFGQMMKVVEPKSFVDAIKSRIHKQSMLFRK